MAVALTLLWIGAGMIVVGIVLAVVGILKDNSPGPLDRSQPPSFLHTLLTLITTSFAVIMNPTASKWRKLAAFGLLLIFLGVAFLIASGVTAAVTAATGSTPPPDTPSPSST